MLLLIKYRLFVIAGFLLIFFFSLFLFSFFPSSKQSAPTFIPIPTTVQSQRPVSSTFISPLQIAETGKKLTKEPDEIYDLIQEKKVLDNGSTVYTFSSLVAARSDQLITNSQNVVIFERVLTPEYASDEGYATITDYMNQFGKPERTIRGSTFYGWYAQTYIYASQGFTFIGNPNTDEIYEFHKYTPMTIERYISTYGEDISTNAAPAGE